MVNGLTLMGQKGYIRFGITINMHQLIYLYVPFFGGILYSYRNQGMKGLIKSIVWLMIPVICILGLTNLALACSLLIVLLFQMCVMIKKGWFHSIKKSLLVVVFTIITSPILACLYISIEAPYQMTRITSFFDMTSPYSYQIKTARKLLHNSILIGKSTDGISTILPEATSNFMLTTIFSYYGIIAAVILMLVMGILIYQLFHICTHQKNQLGLVVGFGCSLVIAVQILVFVLVNLTIIPTTSVFLPLISYGGSGTIVSFALVGIEMSIYRYQSVLHREPTFM